MEKKLKIKKKAGNLGLLVRQYWNSWRLPGIPYGKNGLPVAEGIGYQLIDCKKYTLKSTIKAILIDEATGEEKREVTLKKGERVTYFRTGNKDI